MTLRMMLKSAYDLLLDLIAIATTSQLLMRWPLFSLETTQQNPMISCFSFVVGLYIILVTYILYIPLFNTLSFFPEVKMGGTQR